MNGQNGGFGKRSRNVPMPPQPETTSGQIPPLLKHIGGIAIGAAIVVALFGLNAYSMKQMGKRLDQGFSEQRGGIAPQPELPIAAQAAPGSAIQTCATAGSGACK